MSKKKKAQNSTPAPRRTNTFAFLIYPEWSNFKQIITYIQNERYALILHDMDIKDDETGELKKPHVHVVVRFQGRRTLQSVQNEYKKQGVEPRFVETCNERVMLRYLTHIDDKDKHQYPYERIDTNDVKWVERAYKDNLTVTEQLEMLLDYIDKDCQGYNITNAQLMRYAIANDCYSAMQKNSSMLARCVNEHNKGVELADREELIADRMRVQMLDNIAKSEEKTAQMIDDFFTVADATGFEIVSHNGKRYKVEEIPMRSNDDIQAPEQIDMLKETRKK